MIIYQSTDAPDQVGGEVSSSVTQEVAVAVSEIAHAEPTSGGSYVRDLDTGALIQTAGPALDDQPSKE